MNDKTKQEQIDKLKQLKDKPLPENIKKSIDEKQKHIAKPFNK